MLGYARSCAACGAGNPADAEACSGCGCPARPTVAEIEAARASLRPADGLKLIAPGVWRVVAGVFAILVGGFFVKWSDTLIFTALGVVLIVFGAIVAGRRRVG
jgi:hypothetical protein